MNNDFHEDDEEVADVLAAFRQGEPGVTQGPSDLNQRAKNIVDRAVEEWDSPPETLVLPRVAIGDAAALYVETTSTQDTTTDTTTGDLIHA